MIIALCPAYEETRGHNHTPTAEKALLAAMLDDARKCVSGRVTALSGRRAKVREARRALEWVLDDGEEIQSFRWVCLCLGKDPDKTRREILEAAPHPGSRRATYYRSGTRSQILRKGR